MERLEGYQQNHELHTFLQWKPVESCQYWCDVVPAPRLGDYAGRMILIFFESMTELFWNPVEEGIHNIQSGSNESVYEGDFCIL